MSKENKNGNFAKPMLVAALSSELVTKAKNYAIKCHTETNHKYDGKPYETHLQMVVDYACKSKKKPVQKVRNLP